MMLLPKQCLSVPTSRDRTPRVFPPDSVYYFRVSKKTSAVWAGVIVMRNKLIFILILLATLTTVVHAQDQTTLLLPETDISLEATTTVDVILQCPASNCIGIDVTVAYNPEIVAIEEINAGEFLGANARVIVSDVETEGTLRFSALSSGGARLSEGVIFSLEVTGLTLGESELTVTSMSIFRRGGTIQAVSEAGL